MGCSNAYVQTAKDRAVRFLRDVKDEPERAAEIEDESLEDYAARRGLEIAEENPTGQKCRVHFPQNPLQIYDSRLSGGKKVMAQKKVALEQELRDAKERIEQLEGQLDEIAEIAEPPEDGKETKDELASKLDAILTVASGEGDDESDDEDQDDSSDDDEYDDSEE